MEIRFFKESETYLLQSAIHSIWSENHILSRDENLLRYMFFDIPTKNTLVDSDCYTFLGAWIDGKIIGLLGILPFH